MLIDAACYFGALRKALLKARSTVFVVAKTNTYSDGTCSQGASSNSGENSLEQRPDGCDVRKLHPRDEARKRLTIPSSKRKNRQTDRDGLQKTFQRGKVCQNSRKEELRLFSRKARGCIGADGDARQ